MSELRIAAIRHFAPAGSHAVEPSLANLWQEIA